MDLSAGGTGAPGLSRTAFPAREWNRVAPVWKELFDACPGASFFLGPEWTGAWIDIFGDLFSSEIVIFEDRGAPAGICLLVTRQERRGPFPVQRVYLNASGEDESDETEIELNNLLCLPGYEEQVAQGIRKHLADQGWDELAFHGVSTGRGLDELLKTFGDLRHEVRLRKTAYVDLAKLRTGGMDYEKALGSSTRRHYRQSARVYSGFGGLALYMARTTAEALCMLDELARLHQQSWVARGKPGAFASEKFYNFHRELIRRAFPAGAVQLVRVTAGAEIVGLLYNFVHQNRIYFYQSGLNYVEDNRFRPGLVTFVHTIQHAIDAGFDEFNFLAGDAAYKGLLAADSRELAWVVCQKPNLKMQSIELLRRSKRSLMRIAERRAQPLAS